MKDTPTWFGPPDRALFGWFCVPDSGSSDFGVLLCPPIGEEEHNAHETIRRTAWGLAEHGVASLRFDFHGTGDSTGDWSSPGRVDAWLTSVTDAYDALRATGVPVIGGVGLRIGATLLETACARCALELDLLVLWDACSGRSMLREGYARRPSSIDGPEGFVDTPGYRYRPETVADLQALDPATVPDHPPPRKTLVLNRTDRPPARGLRRRLPPSATVEWDTCNGLSDMLDVPMDQNTVADGAVQQVVGWVAQHADRQDPVSLVVPVKSVVVQRPRGGEIVESTTRLGGCGLFAIRTEPVDRTRPATVVFVNVANDRQTGPGRRWVDLARELAGEGFRCVRLSQSATGDSMTPAGRAFGDLYCPQWLVDLPDALRDPSLAGEQLAVVSLCSGAYSSLEAATRTPVSVVYPINVILTIRDTSRGRRLHSPERRVARPVGPMFLPRSEASARRMGIAWRLYRQVAVWHAPLAGIHTVIRRHTAVVLVMSPADGRHFWESAFWSGAFSWRWRRAGLFRLLLDRHIDHPLMTQAGQEAAVSAIRSDLDQRFPARSAVRARRTSLKEPVS